jgi:hypothetical protein
MVTRIEDQIATVVALRPPRRDAAADAPAPVTGRSPANGEADVIDLARARRRPALEGLDLGPQGGDAA